jgi:ABC-2 type transport system ATP-binding protein
MSEPDVIRFEQVSKRFGGTMALQDVDLRIPAGAVVGVIGRNGSGKTTLLHHVTGLQLPTRGAVRTLGVPTAELTQRHMARIGVAQQHAVFPAYLRIRELLRFLASFYTRWDHDLAQSLTDLMAVDVDAMVGGLSPGHRQRLGLVLALSPRPEVLLLDEPLSDLDPEMRRVALDVLMSRYAEDTPTILLSSHLLHDIEPVITHVLALDRGRITSFDEFDTLKERHGANLEQLFPLLTAGRPMAPLALHSSAL